MLAIARFFRKVPRHFEIDLVGRQKIGPRPTLVNDVGEFVGDVELLDWEGTSSDKTQILCADGDV